MAFGADFDPIIGLGQARYQKFSFGIRQAARHDRAAHRVRHRHGGVGHVGRARGIVSVFIHRRDLEVSGQG